MAMPASPRSCIAYTLRDPRRDIADTHRRRVVYLEVASRVEQRRVRQRLDHARHRVAEGAPDQREDERGLAGARVAAHDLHTFAAQRTV